jgi:hypothetical protein
MLVLWKLGTETKDLKLPHVMSCARALAVAMTAALAAASLDSCYSHDGDIFLLADGPNAIDGQRVQNWPSNWP